ncbi:MAG: polysaccharide pyruvyl transferase family protein [Acidobacteria bacterium]|nr:polysaccharide pyruvyl transferase family protein [Acidobacteriota bacterium]
MNKKFLLFGPGIGGNYGNNAIVLGTEKILHRHFPGCEVWLPHRSWRKPNHGNVQNPGTGIEIKSGWMDIRFKLFCRSMVRKSGLFDPHPLAVPRRLAKQSDCVLSIGGDLYTFANKEKDWPYPFSIMEMGNEIIKLGTPYVIWCASVGPLEEAGKRLGEMVEHLRKCHAIIVREQDSYQYLRGTLGLRDNVFLAADPAFVMEPEPFDLPFSQSSNGSKLLAINFSLGSLEHVHGHVPVEIFHNDLIEWTRKILDALRVRVLFVPHTHHDSYFLAPIYEALNTQYRERIHILPEKIGARKTKWAVSRANALMTMRFHCSLAGFSTKTPTLILVSTSKGEKICREMYGDTEFGLPLSDADSDTVFTKIKDLLDNEEGIRSRIEPVSEKMNTLAFSAGETLKKIL